MAKKCTSSLAADSKYIANATDADLQNGLAAHSDPDWWQQDYIKKHNNQAYLRRWGALLRREARRRGLL